MTHLELFAGIGGFRIAIELFCKDAGLNATCVGYSEFDKHAAETYKSCNLPSSSEIMMGDIVSFTESENTVKKLPNFSLLTGGFPCQSFSMMGKQKGFSDDRGNLFFYIIKILKIKSPPFVLLENVKNLITHNRGETFAIIKQQLEQTGYKMYYDVLNSADFGLAQTRNRVFIFAVRKDIDRGIPFSRDLILDNFKMTSHESSLCIQSSVIDILEKHVNSKYYLSDRIKPTLLSDGTGGFISKSEIDQKIARPLTATMMKMHRACQDNYYSDNFISSGGSWDASQYTKEELKNFAIRRLTPSEALLLQGFPSNFVKKAVTQPMADGHLYKQAGNAVSVNPVYAILSYVSHYYKEIML